MKSIHPNMTRGELSCMITDSWYDDDEIQELKAIAVELDVNDSWEDMMYDDKCDDTSKPVEKQTIINTPVCSEKTNKNEESVEIVMTTLTKNTNTEKETAKNGQTQVV